MKDASPQPDPRPAAVTFVTTEHFTLQGARAATISESTGRASVFLSTVSGAAVGLLAAVISTRSAALVFSAGGATATATLSS